MRTSPYPCCGNNRPVSFSGYGPEIIADGALDDGQTTLAYTIGDKWISDGDPYGTIAIVSNALEFEKTDPSPGSILMDVNNLHDGYLGIVGYRNTSLIPLGPHDYKIEFDVEQNDDPDNMLFGIFLGGEAAHSVKAVPSDVGHKILFLYGADPNYISPARQWVAFCLQCSAGSTGVARATNISMKRLLYS